MKIKQSYHGNYIFSLLIWFVVTRELGYLIELGIARKLFLVIFIGLKVIGLKVIIVKS